MNNPKETIKNVSKQVVSTMIKHDITGWPPDCLMLAYQPVRPATKEDFHSESESGEEKNL